jgi:hypothetical protein
LRSTKRLRAIAFDELAASDLTPQQRAVLGRDWAKRAEQEHLAACVFATLASDLAEDGCHPTVQSLVARAASDEVFHAEVCERLCAAFAGERLKPVHPRGRPNIPLHPGAGRSKRTLLHMVEMCCIGETLTTCFLTEAMVRTVSPPMRAALGLLLEDELDHGRVGWAYLGSTPRTARMSVGPALPAMLDRTVSWLGNATSYPGPGDPSLEAYGYLMPTTVIGLYRRSLREVVLAGLESVGIDTRGAVRHARACGILGDDCR